MPGTWFEALIVAGLAVLAWQPRAGWRRTVIAGIVLGTSATFAQVGEAMILPAIAFLLAAGGGWRHAIGRTAALCAAFALPILAYCTGSYLLAGDFFLSHTGVTSFYGRTAAAADCATIGLPAAERGMCPTRAEQAQGLRLARVQPGFADRAALLQPPVARRDRPADHPFQSLGADPAAGPRARRVLP